MPRKPVSLLLAVLVSSCATPVANYQPALTNISIPPLNTETEIGLGEFLIQQGTYSEVDTLLVNDAIEIGLLGSYTISEGTFAKQGEDERYEHFRIGASQGAGIVTKSALADPVQSVARRKSDGALCIVTVFNAPGCEETSSYTMTKEPSLDDNSFQQVLIYNGRAGNTINVGYREFSNDTARPAFSNEIQYDLSVSDVVGYQNARIRVIEATNTSIRYVVLQNFNQAAL